MINKKLIKQAFKGLTKQQKQLLIEKLPTTPRTFTQFSNGFRRVSPLRAKKIEFISKGAVKASALRPDVFGKNI